MATEKILNTRIQLKYDTLSNWNGSSFKLKAGELAIVTLGSVKDGNATGNAGQHPVLFKVGTGNHTFAELPFASALAADVYAWGKAADVIRTGKKLQFVDANESVIKEVEFDYITSSEAQTLIDNALKAYSTTEQMNAAIKVETDRAEGEETKLANRIKALEDNVGVGEGTTSIDSRIDNAIKALDSSASKEAGADGLALGVTIEDGKVTSITGSIKAETYDAFGSASTAETNAKSHADSLNTAMNTRVEALEAIDHDHSNKALLDTYKQTEADLADAVAKKHSHDNKEVLDGITATKVTAWDNAEKNAKAYADGIKDALLGDGIKETFDTLVEIQNWIEGDGINATELTEAIADEAELRENADKKIAEFDAEGKLIAGALSDEADARAKADDELSKRIDALNIEGGKVASASHADAAGKVDNALTVTLEDGSTKVVFDGSEAKSFSLANLATKAYADQAEADALKDAKAYADSLAGNYATSTQGAKADTALQQADIATGSANGTIAVKGTDVAVKGLGSAAYTASSAYATAEQGTKANSALQSIEAGTGLKVSAKADNKQTVEIDTNVVFVFNCGSATTLID